MANQFRAWIPVEPRAMKRPRVFRTGHAISPTRDTVDEIALHLGLSGLRAYVETVGKAPISVLARFFLHKPPTTKFKYPTSHRHGDLDNHAKTLLDAIDSFIPDAQVCKLDVTKEWQQDGMGAGIWTEIEIMEGIEHEY